MNPIIWTVIGVVILATCFKGKGNRKTDESPGKSTRIDHLHYIDADEYECSVCGAHFRKEAIVCPKCGARFQAIKEDDDEYIEEMVIWDDDN